MSQTDWSGILTSTKQGPRSTIANAVTVLQTDPTYSADIFWHDDFLDRVLIANSPIREWRDDDDTRLTVHLQQVIQMHSISENQAASAVRYVAKQRRRHCVLDMLKATPWDGVPRIAMAFEDHWGALPTDQQPSDYLRAISANLFLGMVARVLFPGCQLDNMVIFEGAQGIGKSQALRVLGGDYYMLAAESVMHKDFFQLLPGKWVVEIGEMDSFNRGERERVKLAISTPTDRYRSSYGRRAEDHPRQCIFAGTTNRFDYGNDETGLRRFWPVRCGDINAPGLLTARPQLLAEAYTRVSAGEPWWQTPVNQTLEVQRDRQHDDIWTDAVLDWLIGKRDATSAEILDGALKFKTGDMTRTDQNRVGSILRLAGWKHQAIRRDGKTVKGWTEPVTDDLRGVTF